MSFRSASVGGHGQGLFQPRQLFLGFADGQLADVHLQFEIGQLFVELLAVELDEGLAGVDLGAMLDDLFDLELRPLFGPQGDGRHFLGGESAVERDDDAESLGLGFGGFAILLFLGGFFIVLRRLRLVLFGRLVFLGRLLGCFFVCCFFFGLGLAAILFGVGRLRFCVRSVSLRGLGGGRLADDGDGEVIGRLT